MIQVQIQFPMKARQNINKPAQCLPVPSANPAPTRWNTQNISPIAISIARQLNRQRKILRLNIRTEHNMEVGNAFRTVTITSFVAIALCAAATQASASCGDYLHTKQGGPDSTDHQDQQPGSPASMMSKVTDHRPSNPQSPCNGPFCQNRNTPGVPFAPASIELRTSADPCCGLIVDIIASASPQRTVSPKRAKKLQGYPGTIDHPPKNVC